ncbi:hypothetical protein ACHHYP_20514 [Achlya hypogyna]|uniref:DDE Tnp4 domain-containing protein n=1 Tax=Achlya hypogyna TaxID=1202772 RepID=A0A1V9YK28_ACHHY|nr:hypothetical protein ACHHYP_20514 [Achlya hypogyna]
MDWNLESERLIKEREFDATLRMPPRSFERLVCLVTPHIAVNERMSVLRTGISSLSPANQLQLLLAYLSGGFMIHLRRLIGTSRKQFYRIIYRVMVAFAKVPCLDINARFPKNDSARRAVAARFANDGENAVLLGCVGVIDGWLCTINRPRQADIGTVGQAKYYSGHYMTYGINHAMQNAKQFTYAGHRKYEPKYDAFNFYLSQLRTKIERLFGFNTTKWRILRRPLQAHLAHNIQVIAACFQLTNYCIEERLARDANDHLTAQDIEPLQTTRAQQRAAAANGHSIDRILGYFPSDVIVSTPGQSIVREAIVEYIASQNLTRPVRNLKRRAVD